MRTRLLARAAPGSVVAIEVQCTAATPMAAVFEAARERLGWFPTHFEGRAVGADETAGSVLVDGGEIGCESYDTRPTVGEVVVDVIAGPSCGRRFVPSGESVQVGRRSDSDVQIDDASVGRVQCRLEIGADGIVLAAVSATNPMRVSNRVARVGDVIRYDVPVVVGYSAFVVRRVSRSAAVVGPPDDGRRPLSPSARERRPIVPVVVTLDSEPSEGVTTSSGAWLTSMASVVTMVGLAATTGRGPALIALSILAPIIGIAVFFFHRRRLRSTDARRRGAWEQKRDERLGEYRAAVLAEASALRWDRPSAPELVAEVAAVGSRVWERLPSDNDFLAIRVGTGSRFSRSELRERSAEEPARHVMAEVPVVLDLLETPVVGIVGKIDEREPVLRWLLAQITVLHSPAHVRLHLIGSSRSGWLAADWLPHVDSVETEPAEIARALDEIAARAAGRVDVRVSGPVTTSHDVVIIHDVGPLRDQPALQHVLDAAQRGDVVVVLGASDATSLPPECAVWAATDGSRVRLGGEAAPAVHGEVLQESLDLLDAQGLFRRVAGWRPAGAPTGTQSLPYPVPISAIVAASAPTQEAIQAHWFRGETAAQIPVGISDEGVHVIDFATDPHWLVVGTPGSGKSETLRTMICSAAVTAPPDRLGIVLVDFGGEAGFGACQRLPHVVGFVSNLEAGGTTAVTRALELLEAELTWRERVCRDAGVDNLTDYRAKLEGGGLENMTRLLVVFDELADLIRRVPTAERVISTMLAKARKYGVTLILGTQSPRTVSALSPNISGKVGLRMSDEGDSSRIIGDGDCTRISSNHRMRGYIRSGSASKVLTQFAWSGAPWRESEMAVDVQLVGTRREQREGQVHRPELDVFVDAICAAAGSHREREVMPEGLTTDIVVPIAGDSAGRVVVGRIDDIGTQTQSDLVVDLRDRGHVAVMGGSRSGRSTFVRSVVSRFAHAMPPSAIHIAIVDLGDDRLRDLEELPHVIGVVGEDEHWRAHVLFDRLRAEIVARSEIIAAHGVSSIWDLPDETRPPAVLLAVDNCTLIDERLGRSTLPTFVTVLDRGPALGIVAVLAGGPQIAGDRRRSANTRLYLRAPSGGQALEDLPVDALQSSPDGRVFVGGLRVWGQLAQNVASRADIVTRWASEDHLAGAPTKVGRFATRVFAPAPSGDDKEVVLGRSLSGDLVSWSPTGASDCLLIAGAAREAGVVLASVIQQLEHVVRDGVVISRRRSPSSAAVEDSGWRSVLPVSLGSSELECASIAVLEDDGATVVDRAQDRDLVTWLRGHPLVAVVRPEDRLAVRRMLLDEGRRVATVLALTPLEPDVVALVKAIADVDISRLPIEYAPGRAIVACDGEVDVVRVAEARSGHIESGNRGDVR